MMCSWPVASISPATGSPRPKPIESRDRVAAKRREVLANILDAESATGRRGGNVLTPIVVFGERHLRHLRWHDSCSQPGRGNCARLFPFHAPACQSHLDDCPAAYA